MTVIIDKSNSKEVSEILSKKLKNGKKEGNLKKHFGKLKRNIDGMSYQTTMRETED